MCINNNWFFNPLKKCIILLMVSDKVTQSRKPGFIHSKGNWKEFQSFHSVDASTIKTKFIFGPFPLNYCNSPCKGTFLLSELGGQTCQFAEKIHGMIIPCILLKEYIILDKCVN